MVFKLHGLPHAIISDRDPVFLSTFWTELFTLQGVDLKYSIAYHPQSDRQTEVVNKCIETYLRCMCGSIPIQWTSWLSLAEYWYNTQFHRSLGTTPYEVLYGQPPDILLPFFPGTSVVSDAERTLQTREQVLQLARDNLKRAQDRMKTYED